MTSWNLLYVQRNKRVPAFQFLPQLCHRHRHRHGGSSVKNGFRVGVQNFANDAHHVFRSMPFVFAHNTGAQERVEPLASASARPLSPQEAQDEATAPNHNRDLTLNFRQVRKDNRLQRFFQEMSSTWLQLLLGIQKTHNWIRSVVVHSVVRTHGSCLNTKP